MVNGLLIGLLFFAALMPASFRISPRRRGEELLRTPMSLNVSRVTGVINGARDIDRHLAVARSRRADSLAFSAVLKARESAREPSRKEAS